jgi:cobalamin biosynthesis Mg chelatase CobN
MRQRKSRPHNFTFVIATALVAIAAIAPAVASADAGGDEYTLNVPGGGNTPINGQSGGGGGGGSSNPSSDVSQATATDTTEAPATESTVPAGTDTTSAGGKGSNHHANNGDKNSSKGNGSGEKPRNGLVSPDNTSTPTVGASSSDDGGVPIFLIAIAVLAAACVGVAIWRMRRSGGGTGGESRSTTEPGTQSL